MSVAVLRDFRKRDLIRKHKPSYDKSAVLASLYGVIKDHCGQIVFDLGDCIRNCCNGNRKTYNIKAQCAVIWLEAHNAV